MITDFLKTKTRREDLATALRIVREFKECESGKEFLFVPFIAWAKLEQLEEFLENLTEGKALKEDTVEYMESMERENGE